MRDVDEKPVVFCCCCFSKYAKQCRDSYCSIVLYVLQFEYFMILHVFLLRFVTKPGCGLFVCIVNTSYENIINLVSQHYRARSDDSLEKTCVPRNHTHVHPQTSLFFNKSHIVHTHGDCIHLRIKHRQKH